MFLFNWLKLTVKLVKIYVVKIVRCTPPFDCNSFALFVSFYELGHAVD